MIVNGLDTNRTYSADEVVAMRDNGKLRSVTLEGWFFRWEPLKGGMRMVHFTDPTANRMTPGSAGGVRKGRTVTIPDPLPQMRADVEREFPIRKRTPQERLASMTNKLMGGERGQEAAAHMMLQMLQGAGDGVDALTDEKVAAITGASWKGGDPIDADTVRRVAARYLGQAERKVAEQARETNTKAGRKARKEQERLENEERKWAARVAARKAREHQNSKNVF
jgi:hypothetical protein